MGAACVDVAAKITAHVAARCLSFMKKSLPREKRIKDTAYSLKIKSQLTDGRVIVWRIA
jgi:hypothetical protein